MTRMRGGLIAIAVLCAGCATGPSLSESDQRHETSVAYVECMQRAAREIDDGLQDLMTIAYAVKARCGREWLARVRAYSSHLPSGHAARFQLDEEPNRLSEAAEAVAIARTSRRPTR